MTQENYLIAEFPDENAAIQRRCSKDQVFGEICEDLALLGRDIALFSEEAIASIHRVYLVILESMQALGQKIAGILRSKGNFAADGL